MNLGSGGSTYDGITSGSPPISSVDKLVGTGAIGFSATLSQYVQIPAFTTGNAGLSFAFWFKFTGGIANNPIFRFASSSGSADVISFSLDSNAVYANVNMCQGTTVCTTQGPLFGVNVYDGVWRHVTWTIDTLGNWLLYLNGELHSTYRGLMYPTVVSRSVSYLGCYSAYFLNGAIDEFYLYQYAISASQVMGLYQQGTLHRTISVLRL